MHLPLRHPSGRPATLPATTGGSPRTARTPTRRRALLAFAFLLVVAAVEAGGRWSPAGPLQALVGPLAVAAWSAAIAWALWDEGRR